MESVAIPRKPAWIRSRIAGGKSYASVKNSVMSNGLHTVCESANCPNRGECWSGGTATFMILGNTCTRGCRFCDVPKGKPGHYDREEPRRVLTSAKSMGLDYVVVTSVARDDLPDQGVEVWAETILALRSASHPFYVEALIPDMQGDEHLLEAVFAARPHVLNHNFETVARLQSAVRGRGNLKDSAKVLRLAKARGLVTKTSFMLGLGEEVPEVEEMLHLCAHLKVDIVTFGQYLPPSRKHAPVVRYLEPSEFESLREKAEDLGIPLCQSGPLVRSSYRAEASIPLLRKHYAS